MHEDWRSPRDWTPLTDNAVDVWRLDLTVTEEDWEILSPDESERARRIVVEGKRSQKASSRAQLRRILALYVESEPGTLRFEYGEHGKPRLVDHMDLSFNLSHSETVGLVGVSRRVRLGIDVEHTRGERDFSGLARRFFSKEESSALERLPDSERPAAFYRAWTRKEAYLKALGTGLSFPSNAFTIEYTTGGPGRVTATEMPDDDPEAWRFADVDISPEFAGAVCLEGPERLIRWWGPA